MGDLTITFTFEGQTIQALEGDTVASALLAAGIRSFRETAVQGTSRGPFCMMGACFDCLVEIDGVSNQQACTTVVQTGMKIAKQKGPLNLDFETIGAQENE